MINKIENIETDIISIYKNRFGKSPDSVIKLPNSGSNRIYFRIYTNSSPLIAVYNENKLENKAFINFTNQFLKARINVPYIILEDLDKNIYFQSDLGDITLLEWLLKNKTDNRFTKKAFSIYKKVIRELIKMQIIAGRKFDYSLCQPFKSFDKKAILFDLDYFKTYFLKGLKIKFNEDKLDSEFETFADYLLTADNNFFMFRDFQARNIMLVNEDPFFIDYQGGRKGALQYDLASLLYQAKAEIPETIKVELLNYYISIAQLFTPINKNEFVNYFFGFALIRVLQTLGAYGLRGIIERKAHFIESIPLAIENLRSLFSKSEILKELPELKKVIKTITNPNLNLKF